MINKSGKVLGYAMCKRQACIDVDSQSVYRGSCVGLSPREERVERLMFARVDADDVVTEINKYRAQDLA